MIRTNLFSILLARFQETLDLPLGVSHLQVHNQYLVCVCVCAQMCSTLWFCCGDVQNFGTRSAFGSYYVICNNIHIVAVYLIWTYKNDNVKDISIIYTCYYSRILHLRRCMQSRDVKKPHPKVSLVRESGQFVPIRCRWVKSGMYYVKW